MTFPDRRTRVFCVGFNKTGTTTLEKTLRLHDYKLPIQSRSEALLENWYNREWTTIIKFTKRSGQAFQDIPYSLPYTYAQLDRAFPKARFILSIRNSSDEWYESLLRFHCSFLNTNDTPTKTDLMNSNYIKKGWMYWAMKWIYNTEDENLYDRSKLIKVYEMHNDSIIEYFRSRSNKLLVLNLSEPKSYSRFCEFLDLSPKLSDFPVENKST